MGERTGKPRAKLSSPARAGASLSKYRPKIAEKILTRLTRMKRSYEEKERTRFTWDEFLDVIEEELAKHPPEYAERLKRLKRVESRD